MQIKMPKTADQLQKPRKLPGRICNGNILGDCNDNLIIIANPPVLLWWCQTLRTSKGSSIKVSKPMVSKHMQRLVNTPSIPESFAFCHVSGAVNIAGTSHARSLLRCSSGGIQHAVTSHCLLVLLGCWMSKLLEQKASRRTFRASPPHQTE